MRVCQYLLMKVILCLAAVLTIISCFKFHSLPQSEASLGELTLNEITRRLIAHQDDFYRKVTKRFLDRELAKATSQSQILANILAFTKNQHLLQTAVTAFMREELIKILEIQKLVESLKTQINRNPDNFFLTFEMYDLLVD